MRGALVPLAALHLRVRRLSCRWRVVAVHAEEMVAGQHRGVLPISSAVANTLSMTARVDPETPRGQTDRLRS
jgi:hypothetical protein